jgi:hypothetical protein
VVVRLFPPFLTSACLGLVDYSGRHSSFLSQIAQVPMHRDIDTGLSSSSSTRILGFRAFVATAGNAFLRAGANWTRAYFAYDLRNGRMSKAATPQDSQEGSVSLVLSKNTLVQPKAYGTRGCCDSNIAEMPARLCNLVRTAWAAL